MISASGLNGIDTFHFDLAGQREFGKRYGTADDAGFEAHLTKPVSLELLLAVLDQCVSSGQLTA